MSVLFSGILDSIQPVSTQIITNAIDSVTMTQIDSVAIQSPGDSVIVSVGNISDGLLKSFDLASEVSKQLLTLAVAILTLTSTIFKETFLGKSMVAKRPLWITWILFILSIFCGIITLLALAGEVSLPNPNIWDTGIRVFAGLQILLFIGGLFGTSWTAYKSFTSVDDEPKWPIYGG